MRCTRCQAENPPAARFCMQCGAALPVPCPHCGAELPADARFCVQCGEPVHPSAVEPDGPPSSDERRIATVVLADVKGSTALAERIDTETWVEIMRGIFQVLDIEIYRHGGQIDQYRGDGLVAFFGVPTAHEDDAERAVLAALAMQEATDRYAAELRERHDADGRPIELQLRVGVNTGEVVVTSVGDRRWHSEDTAMGRAVALAARMETAAAPGTVLVAEYTHRLVAPLFEWEAQGKIAAKGIRDPVAAYRPLAHRTGAGKGRGIPGLESRLVGRDAELDALQEAVERLRAGVGGIVTLVGEAGLGKSRLVAELRKTTVGPRHAQAGSGDAAIKWAEGRCLSYGDSIAYLPWLGVLRELLGVTPEAAPVDVRAALGSYVRPRCPGDYDQVYPYLCKLMSLPLEDEYGSIRDLQGESLRAEIFAAVSVLIRSTAQHRPLVIACEDLQWADPTSLRLLEQLLALTDQVPLLFLCVLRPETEHGCWRIKETAARLYRHRHTDLWLEALSPAESARLVSSLLRTDDAHRELTEGLPPAVRERIVAYGEGNPFYLEELLRSLIDTGAIAYREGTWRWQMAGDTVPPSIPDTLHGVLTARIDRLEAETRHVLRLASVIGRVFPYRILAEIARDDDDLPARLLALQRQQLIRERTRVPELEYIFKHELTREAAYNGLLRRERRAYHERVAEALERLFPERIVEQAGLLAYHWERAEKPQRATPCLLQAGHQARAAYANQEGIAYYQRALALIDGLPADLPRPEWKLAALSGLGKLFFGIGRRTEAEAMLQEAVALALEIGTPPREVARLYYWLGEVLFWLDRSDEQVLACEKGLALLGADTTSAEAALMNQEIAIGRLLAGEWSEFNRFTRRTAGFLREVPYCEELRPAYSHVIIMHILSKDVEQALDWLRALREVAERHHDLRGLGEAHEFKGSAFAQTGMLHQATVEYRQALELYAKIGDPIHEGRGLNCLGAVYLSVGDLVAAQEYTTKGIEAAKAERIVLNVAWTHWRQGQIALCRGDWPAAMDAFGRVIALYPELDVHQGAGASWVYLALGRACLAQGRHRQARERFEEALATLGSGAIGAISQLSGALYLRGRITSIELDLADALSGLEAACDDPAIFRALCHGLHATPVAVAAPGACHLIQWVLEPSQPGSYLGTLVSESFVGPLSSDWVWQDPLGDSSFTAHYGLQIHAPNGRDLWNVNLSAPRLLTSAPGTFAAQTVCTAPSVEQPAIGGIVLWKDADNWLRLSRGMFGPREISFLGCLNGLDAVIGRGCLRPDRATPPLAANPSDPSRIVLRLERMDDEVSALCSTDGEQWYTVGHVAFPSEGPLRVGPHAIGFIDRTIYHGAYPDGTAIRFESFELWGK